MSPRSLGWLLAAALVVVSTPGCSSRGGLATELGGRRFVSESAVGFKLVEGKPISIRFADGYLSASGGCNDISGKVRIENGTLQTNGLRITEMGCMDATGPQEMWLFNLLKSHPTIMLEEPKLTIAGKDATLTLVAEKK